jgi:hypothetical protein
MLSVDWPWRTGSRFTYLSLTEGAEKPVGLGGVIEDGFERFACSTCVRSRKELRPVIPGVAPR